MPSGKSSFRSLFHRSHEEKAAPSAAEGGAVKPAPPENASRHSVSPGQTSSTQVSHAQDPAIKSSPPRKAAAESTLSEKPGPVKVTPTYSTDPNLLWDEAYDAIKGADPELIEKYESFLKDPAEGLGEDISAVQGAERRQRMDRLLQHSLERTAKLDRVEGAVGSAVDIVLSVKDTVGAAVSAVPIAAAAWTPICIALSVFSKSVTEESANRGGVVEIVKKMKWYSSLSLLVLDDDAKGDKRFQDLVPLLADRIRDLYVKLLHYVIETVCTHHSNPIFRNFKRLLEDWKATMEGVVSAETAVTTLVRQLRGETANSYLKLLVKSQLDQKQTKIMQALFVVNVEAEMASLEKRKDPLLLESYEWIFKTAEYQQFTEWHSDPKSILWIRGDAGMGKTMLMMGTVHELQQKLEEKFGQPFLAYFFCQGTDSNLNNATSILKSLMWQLIRQEKSLIKYLTEEYDVTGDQFLTGSSAFYTLTKAFKSALEDEALKQTTLVIDALDECTGSNQSNWQPGLQDLLQLILDTSTTHSSKVKWLVSSRKHEDIKDMLMSNSEVTAKDENANSRLLSLDVNPTSVAEALNAYIDWKVNGIRLKYVQQPSANARPSELRRLQKQQDSLDAISHKIREEANGTFLWVSIVFRELGGCEPQEMLKRLDKMPLDLQSLYGRIIKRVGDSPSRDSYKTIITIAVTAYRPLSVGELVTLADINQRADLESYLEDMGLLTVREGVVYLLHQSTKDYLLHSEDTDLQELFPTKFRAGHQQIVTKSFEAMSDDLCVDIYGLNDPDVFISDVAIPESDPLKTIRYSCAYWIDHLNEISEMNTLADLREGAVLFLQRYLFQWLEALSLMERLSDILKSIVVLEHNLESEQTPPKLLRLVVDIARLIRFSKEGIENYPLQVYFGARELAPTCSITRECSRDTATATFSASPLMENWDECVYSFSGNSHNIAMSPCGKKLATFSGSNIRIFDLLSGSCSQVLKCANGTALSYSHLGQWLAARTMEGKVLIWDVSTGVCIRQITPALESSQKKHVLNRIQFSPVDDCLAVAASPISIWNIHDGSLLRTIEHELSRCVHFSPDGKLIVAASQVIRVWEVSSGQPVTTMHCQGDWAVFSPDGEYIASLLFHRPVTSGDVGLKLWNARTGVLIRRFHPLDGNELDLHSMAVFSPDSKRIAICADIAVELLNVEDTNERRAVLLYGHSAMVRAVAFSPGGDQIATADIDGCVKLWDTPEEGQDNARDTHRHQNWIWYVMMAPDGKWFATVSDGSVKTWEVSGRHLVDINIVETEYPSTECTIAISPDSQLIATVSAPRDGEDPSSEAFEVPLEFNHEVAAQRGRCFVKLWHYGSGDCRKVFVAEEDPVCKLAFSPDNELIASGGVCRIHVWNIASGACIHAFDATIFIVAAHLTGSTDVLGFDETSSVLVAGLYPENDANVMEDIDQQVNSTRAQPAVIKVFDLKDASLVRSVRLKGPETTYGSYPKGNGLLAYHPIRLSSEGTVKAVLTSALGEDVPLGSDLYRDQELQLDEDREWITRNGERLLWLPPVCRPMGDMCCVVSGGTIIIGCGPGHVIGIHGLDKDGIIETAV